jgi:hypothetical protein
MLSPVVADTNRLVVDQRPDGHHRFLVEILSSMGIGVPSLVVSFVANGALVEVSEFEGVYAVDLLDGTREGMHDLGPRRIRGEVLD